DTKDILETIEKTGDKLAIVMMGGVNYYTGQFFNLKSITATAHKVGAMAGFDLAHAVGNVPLDLHKWKVDFACWCSYKYLNAGPGAVAGLYVHQNHGRNPETPRLAGWWGHNEKKRFKMEKSFVPMKGAESWQMSNAPVLNMVGLLASMDIFDKVDMEQLRSKSTELTGYLEFLLKQITH